MKRKVPVDDVLPDQQSQASRQHASEPVNCKMPPPTSSRIDNQSTTSSDISAPISPTRTDGQVLTKPGYVCYGSILDVKVQIQRIPNIDVDISNGNLDSEHLKFDVDKQGSFFALFYARKVFALLNKKACQYIRSILQLDATIKFDAFVSTQQWKIPASGQGTEPKVLLVELNIYGPRQDSDKVGSVLSKAHTFLQRPQFGLDNNFPYHNPQFLALPGFKALPDPESLLRPPEAPLPAGQTGLPDALSVASLTSEVDQILDSLSHRSILCQRQVDGRIKTQLFPYQREAVDFILQREAVDVRQELSLWEKTDESSNTPSYRHIINGAKSPLPDDPAGGILADEMGLGKTLVMLTTIGGSSRDAAKHASAQIHEPKEKNKTCTRATLIVAPSSLLTNNWVEEIRKHTWPGDISFFKYHGPSRADDMNLLMSSDIVLTTYGTVLAELRGGTENSPLSSLSWFRIVLDEAHTIRNQESKQFTAISSLHARHRWCLTGTPIQNTLDDLGALVKFLRVPILSDSTAFRRYISGPITSTKPNKWENLRKLLGALCLRRTRERLRNVPEHETQSVMVTFTVPERQTYNEILQQGKAAIDMVVCGKARRKLNSTALAVFLRLRLFCNNGSNSSQQVEPSTAETPFDLDEALSYLQQRGEAYCGYCLAEVYSLSNEVTRAGMDCGLFIRFCGHIVCSGCVPRYRDEHESCPRCPVITNNDDGSMSDDTERVPNNIAAGLSPGAFPTTNDTQYIYPSKLLALLANIQSHVSHKSIVFSFWRKSLELVGQLLTVHGIPFLFIHGSIPFKERERLIKRFRDPESEKILLMTLGTGAEGLNLAIASRIHLVEPQWNPTVEFQAMSRALRLGQTHRVTVIRYIVTETVEESNILSKQRRKKVLAGGGFAEREQLQEVLAAIGVVDQ
ncbi:SNF2 family N-terminal domain-containing protein [Rhypophila decipiens]|uniref:SNF2 family N-terminal domain-containing protein n=1 Tax=Rhypophila decipiens TaxID=261697 RepID=A0AAN6XWE8_9PEZI|nr:SNF2 family N-terminal domain-containing protein [Rhypophila decipiens]